MDEVSQVDPVTFLDELMECRFEFYSITGTSSDWIDERDVPVLLGKLNDDRPCSGIIRVESSSLHIGYSSLSREASFLLKGFIKKQYPPSLDSRRGAEGRKRDVLDWFRMNRSDLFSRVQPVQP